MDPAKTLHYVRPELGPNSWQRLSVDHAISQSVNRLLYVTGPQSAGQEIKQSLVQALQAPCRVLEHDSSLPAQLRKHPDMTENVLTWR